MNVGALIKLAESSGVRIHAVDGNAKLRGDATAIKALMPKLAEHKAEIIAHLQRAERTGEFWPWAPYLDADDVQRFRAELVGMIERLADLESWPVEYRDDVLARAILGPLADLLPNLHHFGERLRAARAEAAARNAAGRRAWRFDR